MFVGESGPLPRTTERYRYVVAGAVFDDDILVVVLQLTASGRTTVMDRGDGRRVRVSDPGGEEWAPGGGRFFVKAAAAAAAHKQGQGSDAFDPGGAAYAVIGTKTLPNGQTLPRLSRVGP